MSVRMPGVQEGKYCIPFSGLHAIVVGIENYRKGSRSNSMSKVQFAHSDADAFAQTLRNIYSCFGEDDLRIEVIKDSDASLVALTDTLSYAIRNLREEDLFVFYYAGHGFHGSGGNRLSAYDTNPFNAFDTSLDLNECLLQPLSQSLCKRSLLFVDACASKLRELVDGREIVSDLHLDDVKEFLDSGWYCGVFLSCSPGEKSYPAPKLAHGVWTGHLLQALNGEVRESLTHDRWLTDVSLRDWLRQSVPRYITREMSIDGSQTPQAIVSASNTFRILFVPPSPTVPQNALLSKIELHNTDAYLENVKTGSIRSLDGFTPRVHTVPKYHSDSADAWVSRLLDTRVEEILQKIYLTAKDRLSLRRHDTRKETTVGSGNLDTPVFRYVIETMQNPDNPQEYAIVQQVSLRDGWETYTAELDDIFGKEFEKLVVEFDDRGISFDNLIDALEEVKERNGGLLEENDREESVVYQTDEGEQFIFDLTRRRFEIAIRGKKCIELLRNVQEYQFGLTGEADPMLPSPVLSGKL